MPKRAAGLSAVKVKVAQPGRYHDGDGLALLVRGAESAFWVFRYMRDGRAREAGLGRARGREAVPLAAAREKARELRRVLADGHDPLERRDLERAAAQAAAQQAAIAGRTFRTVAHDYIAAHRAGWSNPKHARQWESTLEAHAYPHFGDVPVAEITTAHVLAALNPIWNAKTETATRVRGRVEAILDYAKAHELRDGDNPARWTGHLRLMLPARAKVAPVQHHGALPYPDLPAFFVRLRANASTSAPALLFAILTAARSGEALGARWTEIDRADRTWNVPAERMKARKPHRVPLSAAALALLDSLPAPLREDGFLFPGGSIGKPLSNMALTMLLRRMDVGDVVTHGFRSTFRDWAADKTAFPNEVQEAALAHTIGNKVEAAYRRGDLFEKRRGLMEAWAAFAGGV